MRKIKPELLNELGISIIEKETGRYRSVEDILGELCCVLKIKSQEELEEFLK
jgi:hypothetical protein